MGGCNTICTGPAAGYTCIGGDLTNPSVCTEICGDGVKTGSQACDDGPPNSGDGCSATCTIELGYSCTGSAPSLCKPICGDGRVITPETCDDGINDTVGCNSTCDGNLTGYNCTGGDFNTPTTCSEGCGDGVVTPLQTCDDGNTNSTDGCDSTCNLE